MFLHDNAGQHVTKLTGEKFCDWIGKLSINQPYSAYLVPIDCHLFRVLQNFLKGKASASDDELKTKVSDFFDRKQVGYYNKSIHDLFCL